MSDTPEGTELAWQRAADRATATTLLALIDERDRLRVAHDRLRQAATEQEKEASRLNEALGDTAEGYDRLRTRRSVRMAIAVSGLARRARRRSRKS